MAFSVLSDMDARGKRMVDIASEQPYYFDREGRRLIKAGFHLHRKGVLHGTDFGKLLYHRYGLSTADTRLLSWMDVQFTSEQPIEDVKPHRVIARPYPREDIVRYQINDGQYAKLSADGLEICDNGHEGFLFESGQVEPLDGDELLKAFEKVSAKPFTPWWLDVMKTARLKQRKGERNDELITLMYYIVPWLYKWRGIQLPIELVIGESGSGKSSLCEHRLNIITGQPELRNAPTDLKDWHASISNTGGLHVVDNAQLLDKGLRQHLSDGMCRIVTAPEPHIEMRKLYTDNELVKLPVSCSFVITAIAQPFHQVDLLQRSIVVELDKSQYTTNKGRAVAYDSSWVQTQLTKFGGRTMWVAHQLYALQKFFRVVMRDWNPQYIAQYRLINFEQSLVMMAKALGIEHKWIPDYLARSASANISKADWALEGLQAFANEWYEMNQDQMFSSAEIANWAVESDDFAACSQINNSRRLGRYLQSHKQLVAQMCGIVEAGRRNNKMHYRVQR